jgi:hypothetical protein
MTQDVTPLHPSAGKCEALGCSNPAVWHVRKQDVKLCSQHHHQLECLGEPVMLDALPQAQQWAEDEP